MVLNNRLKVILIFCSLNFFFSTLSFAQLYTKLQWMPEENHWGIFVRADSTIQPTRNILLGSGQLTVVVPTGFEIGEVTSHMGAWIQNARANTPIEQPEKDYVSFGVQLSEEIPQLGMTDEALVLTFSPVDGACPTSLYLIEQDDPFAMANPNSLNTNPGNDLQMIDVGNGASIYRYNGNYARDSWNCNREENVITSLEDLAYQPTITVFPNPFEEAINFELFQNTTLADLEITIQDNLGKIVHQQVMKESSLTITLEVAPALYIYQIIDLDSRQLIETGKLLKR